MWRYRVRRQHRLTLQRLGKQELLANLQLAVKSTLSCFILITQHGKAKAQCIPSSRHSQPQAPHPSNFVCIGFQGPSHRLRISALLPLRADLLWSLVPSLLEAFSREPRLARETQQPYLVARPQDEVLVHK